MLQHSSLISDNISPVILKFTLSFVFQPTDNPTTNTIKFSTSSLTAWSALPICPATITSISGYFHNCTQNLNCVPYTPSNQSFIQSIVQIFMHTFIKNLCNRV
ncbi:hypothetical protein QL285_078873 [Trifolium repens]|nr:hypothetical protein QL285_078873 [Trifolium repens]